MEDALPDDLLPELLQLAVEAARSASAGILSGFRSDCIIGSPTAAADLAVLIPSPAH